MPRPVTLVAALCLGLVAGGCGDGRPPGPAAPGDPPAAPGAMAPRLTTSGGEVLLSWLEPAGDGHRLVFAALEDRRWTEPREVVRGASFFANWADLPGVVRDSDGSLLAYWLEKLGESVYAYGVRLARSTDDGRSWQPAGLLHDDDAPVEHGFASFVFDGGRLRGFWLDGRAMRADGDGHGHGPMQLRTTVVAGGVAAPSELLDDRTCECCDTDAASAVSGPVVVYRGRSADEVRDILIVRRVDGRWTAPAPVHRDGWRIAGCPVNGPAVHAAGDGVAVAWYTAADDRPRVQTAFSTDGGATFAAPIVIDGEKPLGRVSLAPAGDGAVWVCWLATAGEAAEIRLARVDATGIADEPRTVARTSASRAAGVPQLAARGESAVVVWIEAGEGGGVRAAAARR
jgi:hypothetical protein